MVTVLRIGKVESTVRARVCREGAAPLIRRAGIAAPPAGGAGGAGGGAGIWELVIDGSVVAVGRVIWNALCMETKEGPNPGWTRS